jgi:hypothetical protein
MAPPNGVSAASGLADAVATAAASSRARGRVEAVGIWRGGSGGFAEEGGGVSRVCGRSRELGFGLEQYI